METTYHKQQETTPELRILPTCLSFHVKNGFFQLHKDQTRNLFAKGSCLCLGISQSKSSKNILASKTARNCASQITDEESLKILLVLHFQCCFLLIVAGRLGIETTCFSTKIQITWHEIPTAEKCLFNDVQCLSF